ncbi:nuclease-related domain-containing protein [Cellulomonas aerilata]|nr:nuclease-related domain-containing protein [Cellulomonas aerilata]
MPASDAVRSDVSRGDAVRRDPGTPPRDVPDATHPEAVATGSAGASAQREYERRRTRREERVRTAHPRLGGLILAVSDEPRSTTAWATGAQGEQQLGRRLDTLTEKGVRVLHDRRIPRTRANIDQLAVSPRGVVVIDAKRYRGRPHLQVEGGLLRPRVERLLVGTRDRTSLVSSVLSQVGLVRDVLDGAGHADVPLRGVLCFVDADWPLLGGSFTTSGVHVLSPRKLAQQLVGPGGLDEAATHAVHRTLAKAFPVA